MYFDFTASLFSVNGHNHTSRYIGKMTFKYVKHVFMAFYIRLVDYNILCNIC